MNRIHTINKSRIITTLALGLTLLLLSWYAAEARPSKLANVIEGKDEADETPTYTFSAPSDEYQQYGKMWRGDRMRNGHIRNAKASYSISPEELETIWLITREEIIASYPEGPGEFIPTSAPVVSNGIAIVPIEDFDENTLFKVRILAFDLEAGTLAWNRIFEEGDTNMLHSPVAAGDYVYQVSEGGSLWAFSLQTGDVKSLSWPIELGYTGFYYTSPVVINDRLYVSTSGFYVIDLYTETIIAHISDKIENFAMNEDATITYGIEGFHSSAPEKIVRAYSTEDIVNLGEDALPLWETSLPTDAGHPAWMRSTPIYGNGYVIVKTTDSHPFNGNDDDRLFYINADNGQIEWSLQLEGITFSTGALDTRNNVLYQPAGMMLHKIDLTPGIPPEDRIIWTFESPYLSAPNPYPYGIPYYIASPTLCDNAIYVPVHFVADETYWWEGEEYNIAQTRLSVIDANDGSLRYSFDETYPNGNHMGGSGWASPAVTQDSILYVDDFGVARIDR